MESDTYIEEEARNGASSQPLPNLQTLLTKDKPFLLEKVEGRLSWLNSNLTEQVGEMQSQLSGVSPLPCRYLVWLTCSLFSPKTSA